MPPPRRDGLVDRVLGIWNSKCNLCKKFAFTLAEVLITLGIIGVVAALTMPTLIANHKKTVAETRLAKFYSAMNQAVKRAEVDYGDIKEWDNYEKLYEKDEEGNDTDIAIPNTEYFNKYFAPYIIATKIETLDNISTVNVYFPDGSLATFSSASIIFYPNAKDYSVVESNTDAGKMRGTYAHRGTKSFTFFFNPTSTDTKNKYHYGKGIEPYKWGWDGEKETLLNSSSKGCRETVSNERAFCTALIQMNGWKIPKDYPLRF